MTGLAVDPTDGTLYGSTARRSGTQALIRINKGTGAGTLIGSYGLGGQTAADIAFLPDGTLLGWFEPGNDDLATINLTTGVATVVGNAGVSTASAGLAVDSSGTVYFGGRSFPAIPGGLGLMTLSATTGLPTGTVPYSPSGDNGLGLAFDPGDLLYGIQRSSLTSRNLVTIAVATGAVTVIGPTVARLDALAFAPDSDGDGIPDNVDACVSSNLSATVVIDGCDSGVANTLDPTGCTIADGVGECAADASNHGDFVSCVAHLTNDLKKAGTISGSENGAIQRCAAQADLP